MTLSALPWLLSIVHDAHPGGALSLAVVGERVYSGGHDRRIRAWRVAPGARLVAAGEAACLVVLY